MNHNREETVFYLYYKVIFKVFLQGIIQNKLTK